MSTIMKRLLGRQSIAKNSSYTRSSATGAQYVWSFDFLTKTTLSDMKTAANEASATTNDVVLYVGTIKHRMHFKNQSNVVSKFTIYDIVCKRTPSGVSGYDSPTDMWDKGLYEMGAGSNMSQAIGQVPSRSPEFRNHFSIHKITNVNMEPGQQHEHTVFRRVNRVLHSTLWDDVGGDFVSGLTHSTMLVWHGSLGHEHLVPGNVSYTPVTMDYAIFTEYDTAYLPNNKPSYAVTDTIPKTITDWDFMGETQDDDTNLIQA